MANTVATHLSAPDVRPGCTLYAYTHMSPKTTFLESFISLSLFLTPTAGHNLLLISAPIAHSYQRKSLSLGEPQLAIARHCRATPTVIYHHTSPHEWPISPRPRYGITSSRVVCVALLVCDWQADNHGFQLDMSTNRYEACRQKRPPQIAAYHFANNRKTKQRSYVRRALKMSQRKAHAMRDSKIGS